MTTSSTSPHTAASVDEILDANAAGLLYFERFLPLASRVPGSEVPRYDEICARYDEQRGLNLEALTGDADAVGAMHAGLGEQLDEQKQLLRVLRLRWHGEAGRTAQQYVAAEQESAGALLDSIEDGLQTMYAAVDVLREAVTDKAELVGSLDTGAIEGHDVDRIDALLAASGIECVPVERASVLARVAPAFPDWAERFERADVSDEFAAEVARRCREWIEREFVPHVQTTCAAVSSVCTATDTAVRECLALVVHVIEEVVQPVFDDLDERSWVPAAVTEESGDLWPSEHDPAAMPAAAEDGAARTQPASTARPPSGATTAAAPAEPEASPFPPATAPKTWGATETDHGRGGSRDDAVAGLVESTADGTVDEVVDKIVNEIVNRVVDALGDTAGDGNLGDETETDVTAESGPAAESGRTADSSPTADPSATAEPTPTATLDDPVESIPLPDSGGASEAVGERGHLEAELDGHRARIAVEHDGAVSLRLETPGLGIRTFELRVGPLGLPEIVEVPGTVDSVGGGASNRSSAGIATTESVPEDPAATDVGVEGGIGNAPLIPPIPPAGAGVAETVAVPGADASPVVDSAPSDEPPAATAEPQTVCVPESSDAEQTVREGPKDDRTTSEVTPVPVPTAEDPPVGAPQPGSTGSGAGLSEAGAL